MFPHAATARSGREIIPIFSEHLEVLEKQLQYYFPDICTESYDWIGNPFVAPVSTQSQLTGGLTLTEEEQLVEMGNDRNLKLLHMQLPLDEFWVQMKAKYPQVANKALVILIQFSTSYLCELGFSILANIKTNKRARLQTLEEEMRVCLSTIQRFQLKKDLSVTSSTCMSLNQVRFCLFCLFDYH